MKNFDDKEKQIQEICDRVRNSDFFDYELKLAFYDILDLVKKAYYEGHDAGVKTMSEIIAEGKDTINNIFKQYNK
jgi:hypothetical protein